MEWRNFNELEIITDKKYIGIRNISRMKKNTILWYKHDVVWFINRNGKYLCSKNEFCHDASNFTLEELNPDIFDYYCEYPNLTDDEWVSGMPGRTDIELDTLYFIKVNVNGCQRVLLCEMCASSRYGMTFTVTKQYSNKYCCDKPINPKNVLSWMRLSNIPYDVDAFNLNKHNLLHINHQINYLQVEV